MPLVQVHTFLLEIQLGVELSGYKVCIPLTLVEMPVCFQNFPFILPYQGYENFHVIHTRIHFTSHLCI